MQAWIMTLMLALVPHAPWSTTYATTARAIDEAAHAHPLYPGDRGVEKTVVELVAVAFFESHFDPHAVGDHGQSLGLGQVGVSNLPALKLTKTDLFDVRKNIDAMLVMMSESHRICRAFPAGEQLAAYATGNGKCRVEEGVVASEHRMKLARQLLAEHPTFWTSS